MEYELHTGPLLAGELIVLEVSGKLVPRRPDDPRPQWFTVLQDQSDGGSVLLRPFNDVTEKHKARRYVCAGARL